MMTATQERARELTARAIMAIGADPGTRAAAQSALVEYAARGPEAARAVGRSLTAALHQRLGELWQAGWEPADLHRVATRGLPWLRRLLAPELEVLGDAMAAELGGYAPGTVEPRWQAQLADVGARTWWPGSSDHLTARAHSTESGWQQVGPAALQVLELFGRLPELQVLGALPGRADAASRAATQRAGQVDQRMLRRVRALLAKAESTPYPAEAETFTAAAQAMMARHSIDAAMLDAAGKDRDPGRSGPAAIRVGTDRPYESPKALLLDQVARANRCRTVWSKELGFATVLGFSPDLRAVETLFTSLLVQSTAAMGREGSRKTAWGRSRTRSFRHSFLMSYAIRIGERLNEVTRAEEDRAGETATGSTAEEDAGPTGAEVVPVLAARAAEVDAATTAMFPHLVQHRTTRVGDAEGWHRGRAAADEASLTALEPLPAS